MSERCEEIRERSDSRSVRQVLDEDTRCGTRSRFAESFDIHSFLRIGKARGQGSDLEEQRRSRAEGNRTHVLKVLLDLAECVSFSQCDFDRRIAGRGIEESRLGNSQSICNGGESGIGLKLSGRRWGRRVSVDQAMQETQKLNNVRLTFK